MKNIIKILLLVLICFTARSQSPTNLPSPSSPRSYYNIGWMKSDSGIINAARDTTVRSRYLGLQIFWAHNGVDSNVWFFNGSRYFHYVRTVQDIYNLLGGVPVMSITTNNTSGPATLSNGVLNIPQYSGGGGGGGNIVSINTLTNPNLFIVTGSTGSDFNIVSVGSTITINIPTGSAGIRGLISTTDWSTFNNKQNQLNGTGFIKAAGTTLTYDNSTYYLASNPNQYITLASLSALSPALYNSGTGVFSVDTTTGLTHLATQAYAIAHGGSGINAVGNLSPLFTTTVISNNLSFILSNATANTVLGNFTGSPAPPTYGLIPLASMAAISANRIVGNPNGSSGTPALISLGYGLKFLGTTIEFDSANVHTFIYPVNGLAILGSSGDSIGLGGTLYQTTHISGTSLYNISFDSTFIFLTGPGYATPIPSDTTNNKPIVRNTTTGKINQMYWPQTGGGGGAVASVSNSDGTLTISPTTGAVIASIALGHANTWTANQTWSSANIIGTGSATLSGFSSVYNNQTSTTYTLQASDNGKIVTISNAAAITLTVPTGLPVGFNCTVIQLGAGAITYTASSTTLNSHSASLVTGGQYAVTVIASTATNVFDIGGDLSGSGGGGVVSVFDTVINIPATANYTVPATTKNIFLILADLTGQNNRNLVLPAAQAGQTITVKNNNTSGSTFNWTFTSRTVKDFGNNTIGTVSNLTVYILKDDGTNEDVAN